MKTRNEERLSTVIACVCCGFTLVASGRGVFSVSDPLGDGNLDASVGVSAAKTYTHAYNIRGTNVVINGVTFASVENFTGVDGQFGMAGWSSISSGGSTIGAGSGLDALMSSFNYNGSENTLTLSNLVAGQTYVLTFYNKAWSSANNDRILAVTSGEGAAITFDECRGGEPNANLLRYTFEATNATEWVKFKVVSQGTMHFYGFSTEQVFNNAWGSGASWTTASWGVGVPNAAGANASLPAQSAPASITLDAPVTVGHVQFDGASAWTVSGDNTLTLTADVGGVSVLSALSGAHAISAPVALSNPVLKSGDGTLTLSGPVSGTCVMTIDAGTLEITSATTLPTDAAVDIAAGAALQLSNAATQTITELTFGGVVQHSGTWGAEGSGAQHTSARLTGTGVLKVLGGATTGTLTASGSLGGGDLDAGVGLDSSANYLLAVNADGGALTINGVAFSGSSGANPAGINYATSNFGSMMSSAQSTTTGQLGQLLNDFNYGDGTNPQTFTLNNLVPGATYTLTFYNRAWESNGSRSQTVTTTSGATTTFNEDVGDANTVNWLRYTFTASGASETVTMTPVTSGNGFHLYGFSVSVGPASGYTDVTRRSSGSKTIASGFLSDVRITEGTGDVGDLTLASYTTGINTLTVGATEDAATVALNNRTLALNGIVQGADAGGLTFGSGVLKPQNTSFVVDNASTNPIALSATIANANAGSATLTKVGTGTLTLKSRNIYSGATQVLQGTLRVTDTGTTGLGAGLTVNGGTLQIDGGTVNPVWDWSDWNQSWNVEIVNSTINETGGWFGYNGYMKVGNTTENLTGGTSYVGLENLLGWSGTNTTVNIGGSHAAYWYVTRFNSGVCNLNLSSGGALYTDQLFTQESGAVGTVRFDGGVLAMGGQDPNRTPDNWIFTLGGPLTLNVENGGAVIDTSNGRATIRLPFQRDGSSTGGLTKTGGNTLTLTALSTYAGATAVQGGTLKLTQVPVPVPIVNAGFELPAYPSDGGWNYLGSDGITGGWSISAGGIARNWAPWVTVAPQGVQIAFLQGTSYVVQNITVPQAATYRLSFKASNRPNFNADNLEVLFDGVTVLSMPYTQIDNGGNFKDYSVDVALAAGAHELRFAGTSPGWDTATAIDDVQINRIDGLLPGTIPAGTPLAVAAGASMDLNGASQVVGALSGGGRVYNSSSTNVTLTVGDSASSSFGGTIEGSVALLKVGSGTQTLSATNTYTGETRIQSGTLQLPPINAAVTIPNASFETHDPLSMVPPTWSAPWQYAPGGATWVFGGSGITELGSPWLNPSAAIDGTDAAFIQGDGTISGTISVSFGGLYRISFLAGKRWGMPPVILHIDIDGVSQLTYTPSQLQNELGTEFTGDLFLSSGTHTLRFRGEKPDSNDDNIWLDRIALTSLGGTLSTNTAITVDTGAVFDLNGNTQSLARVSGDGVISNGVVVLSGVIAPGGTNAIGTLTLAATPVLSGATLLADVATDGAGDLLVVQGDLDLAGLTLQVANLSQLSHSKTYTVAACSGTLSGKFAATNLDKPWFVMYDYAARTAKIAFATGTLVLLR